jgi:hypothetical protein
MPERNCGTCKNQVRWGCTARRWRTPAEDELDGPENWVNPAELPYILDDEETWACPRQPIREAPRFFARVLLLYGMYVKGHLPDRGAIVDQSASLLEVFRIIDDANAEADTMTKAKAEAARRRNAEHGRR